METHAADTFSGLIAPMSMDEFLADYWEKTFLHLRGNDPDRFTRYFSLRDVDTWLTGAHGDLYISSPQGSDLDTEKIDPRDVTLSVAYTSFTRGSLLVLNPMAGWPPLQGLIKALGRELHGTVEVEAHVAPPGSKVFPPFVAGHDVLVLQVEGERVWQLHEFSLLQVNPVQKRNMKFPLEWYGRTKAPVLAEVCLKPGDLLFIPHGMGHHAVAEHGASLHLEFSIKPLYWVDFLKIAAECAALHSQDLRRALPPGFVESSEICERMRQTFEHVMKTFQETASFDEVVAVAKRNRIAFQRYPADGHFVQLAKLGELTADSVVERRRDILCYVEEVVDALRNVRIAIFFGNEHVSAPLRVRRSLEFIRDHRRFRVSEIPGLDEKGQVALVRRLIVEGMLQRVEEPSSL
ncbi:MAG: JmjC domain-containing protein [Thermoanaerobaculia bacterium]